MEFSIFSGLRAVKFFTQNYTTYNFKEGMSIWEVLYQRVLNNI